MITGDHNDAPDASRSEATDREFFLLAMLDTLAGKRCDPKRIVVAVAALLYAAQHHSIKGESLNRVAKRFGISPAALSARRHTIHPEICDTMTKARLAFDEKFQLDEKRKTNSAAE